MHITATTMSTAIVLASSPRAMPIRATSGSPSPTTETSTKTSQRNANNAPIKKLSIAMIAMVIAS
jgi:hypothetical protein